MTDSPLMSQLWQMMLSLALVVMLILLMAWVGKKIFNQSFSSGSPLRLLAGVSLGRRERVVLLQAGSKQLVLGVTQHRIDLLQVLEEPIVDNDTPEQAPLFQQLMAAMPMTKPTKPAGRS